MNLYMEMKDKSMLKFIVGDAKDWRGKHHFYSPGSDTTGGEKVGGESAGDERPLHQSCIPNTVRS
jgi:hypothetical protein